MKRLLATLGLILATAAQAAHVQFDLVDFASNAVTRRTLFIKPTAAPLTNVNDIVTGDARRHFTDTTGQLIVSNMTAGTYSVVVFGPETNTIFSILVPDTTALTNASALLTSAAGTGATTGYTMAQANALFVLKNSGWSSNQIATNLVLRGSTNAFTHTNGAVSGYVLTTDGTNAYWKTNTASGSGTDTMSTNVIKVAGAWQTNANFQAHDAGTTSAWAHFVSTWSIDDKEHNVTAFINTNSSAEAGVVTPGSGQVSKVWKTDAGGVPGWRTDETGTNSPSSNLILTNTIFLAKNGDDATGTRGDQSKPYATLTNAVAALQNGDTLLIYPGDYIVGITNGLEALALAYKTNVSIIGVGLPRIYATNEAADGLRGNLWMLSNSCNIRFSGLEMLGTTNHPNDSNELANAIMFNGSGNKNVLIEKCSFKDWPRFGIVRVLWSFTGDDNICVRDSYFENIGGSKYLDGAAIEFGGSNCKAENNHIVNCFRGIEIYAEANAPLENFELIGNRIVGCEGASIIVINSSTYATNLATILISHNDIVGWKTNAVTTDNSGIDVRAGIDIDISHNKIKHLANGSYAAITVNATKTGAKRYNIFKNTIEDVWNGGAADNYSGGCGIWVQNSVNVAEQISHVSVVGNMINNVDRQGMMICANNALIANNNIANWDRKTNTAVDVQDQAIWVRTAESFDAVTNVVISGNIMADLPTSTNATTRIGLQVDDEVYGVSAYGNFVGPGITPLSSGAGTNLVYGQMTNDVMTLPAGTAYVTNNTWVVAYAAPSNTNIRIPLSSLGSGGAADGVGTFITNLNDLDDVIISDLQDGDTIVANSGTFLNKAMALTNLVDVGFTTNPTSGLILSYNGSAWVPAEDANSGTGGQPASENLTNWATVGTNLVLFTASATGFQPADADLTNWATVGTNLVLFTDASSGFQPADSDLTNWSTVGTNIILFVAASSGFQPADNELTNWATVSTNAVVHQTNGVAYGLALNNANITITTNGTLTASNIVATNFSVYGSGQSGLDLYATNGELAAILLPAMLADPYNLILPSNAPVAGQFLYATNTSNTVWASAPSAATGTGMIGVGTNQTSLIGLGTNLFFVNAGRIGITVSNTSGTNHVFLSSSSNAVDAFFVNNVRAGTLWATNGITIGDTNSAPTTSSTLDLYASGGSNRVRLTVVSPMLGNTMIVLPSTNGVENQVLTLADTTNTFWATPSATAGGSNYANLMTMNLYASNFALISTNLTVNGSLTVSNSSATLGRIALRDSTVTNTLALTVAENLASNLVFVFPNESPEDGDWLSAYNQTQLVWYPSMNGLPGGGGGEVGGTNSHILEWDDIPTNALWVTNLYALTNGSTLFNPTLHSAVISSNSGVTTPVNGTNIANKEYVDALVSTRGTHYYIYGSETNNVPGLDPTNNTYVAHDTASAGGAVTNIITVASNNHYFAAFWTSNTFYNVAGGPADVEIYCYEESTPGSGSFHAEFYLWDGTNLVEIGSSPNQTIPTALERRVFSVNVSATNTSVPVNYVIRLKSASVTSTPEFRLVTEGDYDSHVAISFIPGSGIYQSASVNLTNWATVATNLVLFTNTLQSLQPSDDDLTNWATVSTNLVLFTNTLQSLQPADADLTNWATVATNLILFTNSLSGLQPADGDLTNWSTVETNLVLFTNQLQGLQPSDPDLTNWATVATNLILFTNSLASLQPASANLSNFSTVNTNYFIPTNATLYHYLYVPAGAMLGTIYSNAASGTYTNGNLVKRDTYDFDDSAAEYAVFSATLGDGWDLGTLKAKFHFLCATTNAATTNVTWAIRAGQTTNTVQILGSVTGTAVSTNVPGPILPNELIVSPASPAMTVGGTLQKGYPIEFVVYRDPANAGDLQTGDARLLAVEIQYGVKFNLSAGW